MAKHFTNGAVADIYVEVVSVDQCEAAVDEVNNVHSLEKMKRERFQSFVMKCLHVKAVTLQMKITSSLQRITALQMMKK
jgi:hypothetical protein